MIDPQNPIAAATHPDPYYRRLRERQPLYFDPGCGLWVATSAAMAAAILEDGRCRIRPAAQLVPPGLATTPIAPVFSALLRMTDGDFQQRMKAAVIAALSQIDPQHLQAVIDEAVATLDLGGDIHRLLPQMQYRLPAQVMARLLGVDAHTCHEMTATVGAFVAAMASGASLDEIECGCHAMRALLAILKAAAEAPVTQNITLALLQQASAQGLAVDQALANVLGFLMQSFDATAGLIGNGFLALMELQEDAPADWGIFVDEVLRYDPPVQNTRRVVAQEIEIAGQVLQPNETVLLVLAAANRDPALNVDPDTFRLDRADRRVMTFGHGRHACPGSFIARTIAATALRGIAQHRRQPQQFVGRIVYRPLPNARIPEFAA